VTDCARRALIPRPRAIAPHVLDRPTPIPLAQGLLPVARALGLGPARAIRRAQLHRLRGHVRHARRRRNLAQLELAVRAVVEVARSQGGAVASGEPRKPLASG
jgi:hypothetical protein